MEIAPTSYLRVNGASIVDDSDTAVRLQGPCLGGWMNMENFITGYPASDVAATRAAEGHGPRDIRGVLRAVSHRLFR